jgi:acyl-CoA-binding protein
MDFEVELETFKLAAEVMRNAKVKTSNEEKLRLYGFFKQAECGPCKSAKPAFYDLMGRAKWEAWKKLGEMDKAEAMKNYIAIAERLVPKQEWTNIKQSEVSPLSDTKSIHMPCQ